MGKWIAAGLVALVMAIAPCWPAASEPLHIGTTANGEVAAVFVAAREGFFAKHGIDADIQIIALNPNLPAALLSNSLQIAAPTPTVFAQAVSNGLDLVAFAGVSVISADYKGVAVAARGDSGISSPADFVGKSVATPGLNAVLHIAFELWLQQHGVDPLKVRFVEAPIPTMADLLAAKQVDAVIAVDPFLLRMEHAGTAKIVSYFFAEVAHDQQTMVYASTRDWAQKNPQTIAAFRAALGDAIAFIKAEPDKTRADIGAYFKLPPEILKTLALPNSKPDLTADELGFWAGVMQRFGLLDKPLDVSQVLIPEPAR